MCVIGWPHGNAHSFQLGPMGLLGMTPVVAHAPDLRSLRSKLELREKKKKERKTCFFVLYSDVFPMFFITINYSYS